MENLTLLSPIPYQVVQRDGDDFSRQYLHAPGGPQRGYGIMTVRCLVPDDMTACSWRYRLRRHITVLDESHLHWIPLAGEIVDGLLQATVHLPAGWHRLEIGGFDGEELRASVMASPVGVGELFVIAGQSYAEGCNEALLAVQDPEQRVTFYDPAAQSWRVAHDPQPGRAPGGTIWPPVFDRLAGVLRVPIGLVNVAVGGTASRQWLPGEALYLSLRDAGLAFGRFRAVLWQQGESDVIEGIDTETYYQRIMTIRESLLEHWGFSPLWLPAKSTLHPMVYLNPEGEAQIRAAIDRLWHTPGFAPGPDTDILGEENRADWEHGAHFSAIGQQHAALLWFIAIWNTLEGRLT